jgi:outer membrane receptor protein involved in Fe transport
MFARLLRGGAVALPVLLVAPSFQSALAEEGGRRQLEEVVVTAERKESTVSDTSISITAFTGEMLEDFGIRNQEDLQNQIPAAVIEPYDMAIRGVGRNFRNLGGDPGVATYLNGVYSEDFGIASTEGGLFDIERIEVLRGPQGTLYGRNAIGGAVNFINKLPTEQFEGEARVVAGDYDLQEYYGVLSGPLIPDVLMARATGVKRTRDGYVKDLSGAPDPANYGDENYALGLRWTPTDTIEVNTRGNERSYRRRMGGADAAGIVNFDENRGNIDFGNVRDTTTYAYGYRAVDPTVPCPDLFSRTTPVTVAGVRTGVGCTVPGRQIYTFANPITGAPVNAQRVVAGVDASGIGYNTTDHPNYAYGADLSRQRTLGKHIKGNDLKTDTNGNQDEYFDHQANSTDITWQLSDQFSLKYIFGYTDYFYDRTSDVDLTSSAILDDTFYVSQETEYVSHELQFFWDPSTKLSITSGLFYYDAKISQRGDFNDRTGPDSRYANDPFPFPYAGIDPALAFLDALPKMDLFTAKVNGSRFKNGLPMPFNCLDFGGFIADTYCFGKWAADTGDRIPHGPITVGTNLEYQTRSERNAYAAYTQGTYTFNEKFALVAGLRWARDQLDGEENLFYYNETEIVPLGFGTCTPSPCTSSLAGLNAALGYLDPTTGAILNPKRLLVGGLPVSSSLWRELKREDDDVTWRINLDFTPTADDLIYLSATKGFRAGGFNLVFFSATPKYKPESLIAYELGYKGAKLDGRMQINTAIYYYDYENVHTFAAGPAGVGAAGTSTTVFAVPEAEMIGWDGDITWLLLDNVTVGANFSYTHSEYLSDFDIIDTADPARPNSLFVAADSPVNIKGKRMLRVPEQKAGGYMNYEIPLGANGHVDLLINYSWIGKVYFDVFESSDSAAPAYSRLDLRGTWHSNDEAWTVAAFVNNVMDEIGIRQVDHYGSAEDNNFRQTGDTSDPRLYGLEVRYKFGAFK